MQIHLIKDVSGSMSVLGKSVITKNLIRTLESAIEIDTKYVNLEFVKVEWGGGVEQLEEIITNQEIKKAIIFTDGYAFGSKTKLPEIIKNDEAKNKKYIIVYCGCDANIKKSWGGYKATDILSALDDVSGLYEV